jgi:hypothetical protein
MSWGAAHDETEFNSTERRGSTGSSVKFSIAFVLGEAHLRRIPTRYSAYYNELRTHRSLDKDAPIHRAMQHVGRVISVPVLGRLHHHYCTDFWYRQVPPSDLSAREEKAKVLKH